MPKIDLGRVRRRQLERVNRAKALIKANEDGGYDEDKLLAKLIEIEPFDIDQAKRRNAQALLDAVCRLGGTPVDGQIVLPGFDAFDYEPGRLVRDDAGHIYEADKAPLAALLAESRRARKHADAAGHWANIKQTEVELFAAWVIEQMTAGRKAAELMWGNFIRETGRWQPGERAA